MTQKTLRLLLVEDSEDDEFLLLRYMRKNDYDVTHHRVQDAIALRKALTNSNWNIIISDYSMPNFTGLDALAIARELEPDLPFIMVSGAIGEERAAEVMKAGANDYVTKGNYGRLIPAVERELRETAQRIASREAESQIIKLSTALAQSANLIIIFDKNRVIEYVNHAFLTTTGYSEDEVIGTTADFLRSQNVDQETYDNMWQAVVNNQGWHGELLNQKKNGDLFWVNVTISNIRDDDGNVTHYLAVQEDITERKELEAELQRYNQRLQGMVTERTHELQIAKDRLEAILENSSDGIVLALSSGDILSANPAFRQLFNGYVKRSIEELIHLLPSESDTYGFAEALLAVLYDKTTERTQTKFVTSDGENIDLDLAFAPVQADDGAVEGVVLSVRDITLVKDLERFKSQFIANAAHDLANPIAALKMRLYLLKATPQNIDTHVAVFERQIDRMERLVDELRLLSAFDRGALELSMREVNLVALVALTIEALQPLAQEKNITLHYNHPQDDALITIDPERFERVIVNLISNAITYTRDSGEITIRIVVSDQKMLFEVEDSGIGIEPEALPHIFERFYRTDRARSENNRGTGLGLAIVKELIEAHHGKITINSTVDVGTTFSVSLPL